eukprot:7413229-Pyramimonas_sp.AAC.1
MTRLSLECPTDNSQLGHFFGVRIYFGGELNSPVVEWLNKDLMSMLSPRERDKGGEPGKVCEAHRVLRDARLGLGNPGKADYGAVAH